MSDETAAHPTLNADDKRLARAILQITRIDDDGALRSIFQSDTDLFQFIDSEIGAMVRIEAEEIGCVAC